MGKMQQIASNRLFVAGCIGMLVWLADQPTIDGYNPLAQMFWDPGIFRLPWRDYVVLLLSWFVTTLFCHFLLFAFQKALRRDHES